MGDVVIDLSMSLDGFIAGPDDDAGPLHDWYFTGDTPSTRAEGFNLYEPSRALFDETVEATGAVVVGRRTFDFTHGWGGNPPVTAAYFVVTHHSPPEVAQGTSTFTVVTKGVVRAVELARAAAGDKHVAIMGASMAQQCLRAGLVDALTIHLVPVLLGGGVRLFGDAGGDLAGGLGLRVERVVEAPGVTHLFYRVDR